MLGANSIKSVNIGKCYPQNDHKVFFNILGFDQYNHTDTNMVWPNHTDTDMVWMYHNHTNTSIGQTLISVNIQ